MMQMEKEFNLHLTSDIGDGDYRGLVPHVSLLAAPTSTGDLVWLQGGGIAPPWWVHSSACWMQKGEHLLSRTEVSRKKQWRKAQTWRDI